MGGYLMSLVSAQDRYGDIAILDKAAAVQPAIKSIAHTNGLVRPLGFRSMPLRFAQQTEGFSHLGLGLVTRGGRFRRTGFGRLRRPILVRFAEWEIESQFYVFRQCHHLGIGSAKTPSRQHPLGTEHGSVGRKALSCHRHSVGSSLETISEDIFFKRLARLRGITLMLEY